MIQPIIVKYTKLRINIQQNDMRLVYVEVFKKFLEISLFFYIAQDNS